MARERAVWIAHANGRLRLCGRRDIGWICFTGSTFPTLKRALFCFGAAGTVVARRWLVEKVRKREVG